VVVDDSYNASPESMLAAFAAMSDRPRGGRLLAVLGEMRELGGLADESHRVVGLHAAKVFDAVCVIDGERGRILPRPPALRSFPIRLRRSCGCAGTRLRATESSSRGRTASASTKW
jgi:hypothetical protein